MFFPEKITRIREGDRVLEVGPGVLPYFRSDVYLDLEMDEETARTQRGQAKAITYDKPLVFYDGKNFPFQDREFDYVICSHVLEHVPLSDVPRFIAELTRIAPRGYVEVPSVFYEFIDFGDVHLSFMNIRNNEVLFLDKRVFQTNPLHTCLRHMFSPDMRDQYMRLSLERYKGFYFCGLEWEGTLRYRTVDRFDDLITEEDCERIKRYFLDFNPPEKRRWKKRWKTKLKKGWHALFGRNNEPSGGR